MIEPGLDLIELGPCFIEPGQSLIESGLDLIELGHGLGQAQVFNRARHRFDRARPGCDSWLLVEVTKGFFMGQAPVT